LQAAAVLVFIVLAASNQAVQVVLVVVELVQALAAEFKYNDLRMVLLILVQAVVEQATLLLVELLLVQVVQV
jgi:hypothetical protein